MNWSALDSGILGPALMAGLLVLATHVPLGTKVLDRGIVFIDLAIAQIAGLGVIAAGALGLPEGGVAVQVAAVTAALLGALLLTWTERKAPQQQEALIGVMFVLAACAGILLLASNPHGGEHLKELLVGQILWVSTTQLLWLAGVSAVLLAALWFGGVERLGPRRLLRRLCARGDRVGAARGCLPRVLEPHHPGAGDTSVSRRASARAGLWAGGSRLCPGPGAVGPVRSALGCGDRVDAGGVRTRLCGDNPGFANPRGIVRSHPWGKSGA